MPINAYTGLLGSGKSYEVVSSVIIPAINKGRRVVTNVDGIDSEAIRAYCNEQWQTPLDKCGEVIHCTNADVERADFLPHGIAVDTFVRPGDMVCIDEAYRFWGTGVKIIKEHAIFFREHRHYVDPETKVCCDLMLMTQDIGDLNRVLKVVVEMTIRTTKLKSVGLHNSYKVEIWETYRTPVKSRLSIENKRYNSNIFPLYSSYAGGVGTEVRADDRQNIFRGPKLWLMLFCPFVAVGLSIWLLSRFFHHGADIQKSVDGAVAGAAKQGMVVAASGSSVTGAQLGGGGARFSTAWAVAGMFRSGKDAWVVLRGDGGKVRLEHPSMFSFDGEQPIVGNVDGERVTRFSGPTVVAVTGGNNVGAVASPVGKP